MSYPLEAINLCINLSTWYGTVYKAGTIIQHLLRSTEVGEAARNFARPLTCPKNHDLQPTNLHLSRLYLFIVNISLDIDSRPSNSCHHLNGLLIGAPGRQRRTFIIASAMQFIYLLQWWMVVVVYKESDRVIVGIIISGLVQKPTYSLLDILRGFLF